MCHSSKIPLCIYLVDMQPIEMNFQGIQSVFITGIFSIAILLNSILWYENYSTHVSACVTSVIVGSTWHSGSVLQSPWFLDQSFYFVSNASLLDTVRSHGWTGVLLNASQIPFDPKGGPTKMPELGWTQSDVENMQAKYVKILSHRIPELASCDIVLYMDSKVSYTHEAVHDIVSVNHPCATMFIHPWRTFYNSYLQELTDSLKAYRYARFKPALSKQIIDHSSESLNGVMHLGSTHVFNMRNAEAIKLQNSWWEETLAYSIQDQLSLFWQLNHFQHCITSRHPVYDSNPGLLAWMYRCTQMLCSMT